MNYNFLTLGRTCKPASALRNLGYRKFALPFDWIISDLHMLELCFSDNFSRFHTSLRLNSDRKRLIDAYGFEYPHDYPTIVDEVSEFVSENIIVNNWKDYYGKNKEKYSRRIERFLGIVRSNKPVIVLCEYSTIESVKRLRDLLKQYYNKSNVFFINSSSIEMRDYNIVSVNTEKNGRWNETLLWRPVVESVISQIPVDYVFE